ncbi:hypothetical protein SAMN04487897_1479 [Paenibacillus sp. yr247]|uniref:hypothetical protein n=1 Tax=Paenibacillus sp. yr247 TaxID=1761880 RepID=UPI00087E54AA|nr:hypothetical protein [Paenibacillus sp. yr247]SDP20828.1 hypothetical protein SAMN04487897_1479 [Paenibacillus sp. yr247]
MNELLELTVKTHGGLDRWKKFSKVNAHVVPGGVLWHLKGNPGLLDDYNLEVSTYEQHVIFTGFSAADRRSIYTKDRVSVESMITGETIFSRDNPRASFVGHVLETPWDEMHVAYFASYAMWLYLTQPLLFCSI